MGLPNNIYKHFVKHIPLLISGKYRTFTLVFLFLNCLFITSLHHPIQANTYQLVASVIVDQSGAGYSDGIKSQTGDTSATSPVRNDSAKNAAIEHTLAQKAEMGQKLHVKKEDRFSTILFYALGIGSIGLIIILIFFYLNLQHKGERLKMLRKRMEQVRLRKKAGL
jgi:hypothetical protein